MLLFAVSVALAEDANCNGIVAADEPAVDLADAVCAANIDPKTGLPYPTADSYYDYVSFGCTFLLDWRYDIDEDGMSLGVVNVGGFVEVQLQCDNCPSTYNPDQADSNFDGIGDVCVDEVYLGYPEPGIAGMVNSLPVLLGGSGNTVRIAASTALGATPAGGCPDLQLASPTWFDVTSFSGSGAAEAARNVPGRFAGTRVFFQAIEPATCRMSNVVSWDF